MVVEGTFLEKLVLEITWVLLNKEVFDNYFCFNTYNLIQKKYKVRLFKIVKKVDKKVLTREWNPCIVITVVKTVQCCWDDSS